MITAYDPNSKFPFMNFGVLGLCSVHHRNLKRELTKQPTETNRRVTAAQNVNLRLFLPSLKPLLKYKAHSYRNEWW